MLTPEQIAEFEARAEAGEKVPELIKGAVYANFQSGKPQFDSVIFWSHPHGWCYTKLGPSSSYETRWFDGDRWEALCNQFSIRLIARDLETYYLQKFAAEAPVLPALDKEKANA